LDKAAGTPGIRLSKVTQFASTKIHIKSLHKAGLSVLEDSRAQSSGDAARVESAEDEKEAEEDAEEESDVDEKARQAFEATLDSYEMLPPFWDHRRVTSRRGPQNTSGDPPSAEEVVPQVPPASPIFQGLPSDSEWGGLSWHEKFRRVFDALRRKENLEEESYENRYRVYR